MERTCIFCGQKPENKNKEHVLSRWLLEYTGDPNRVVQIGTNWLTGEIFSFSFDSLVFPACESCNNKYSRLESKVKVIIEKTISYEFLNSEDITLLLDWFDKVRIGLWLGYRYLNKDYFGVIPKFHIDQRIKAKDRFLIINDLNNYNKGLTLIGVNTPFFHYNPICFSLVINDKVFTNVSTDFVVSHSVGFPYPKNQYLMNGDYRTEVELERGTLQLNKRLIRFPIMRPYVILAQPIISRDMFNPAEPLYNLPYINDALLSRDEGIGKICTEIDGDLSWLDEMDEINIDLRAYITPGEARIDLQTYKLQDYLHDKNQVSDARLDQEHKEKHRAVMRLIRDFTKNQLRF